MTNLLAFVLFLASIFSFFDRSHSAKILFSACLDSGSHISSMTPLIKTLASSGHEITVFETSTNKIPRNFGPNITLIHLFVPTEAGMSGQLARIMFTRVYRSYDMPLVYQINNEATRKFLVDFSEQFVHVLNKKWDLIIIDELFGVHSFGFVSIKKKLENTPYLVMSTTTMLPSTSSVLSLGTSISSTPYILPYPPENDEDLHDSRKFSQRFVHGIESLLENLFVNYYVQNFALSSMKLFGIHDFTWYQLYKQKSGYLVDYVDRIGFPKPAGTDLFFTCSHCVMAKNLSNEYDYFMNDPTSKGTIYIAFGTNVLWEFAPESVLDAFFDAVNELEEYRIIFSFNGKKRSVKKHVLLTEWAPQVEILNHPSMKVFVSHGGLKSVKEALCSKVPVVFMSMFAEQSYNVKLMLEMGVASTVNKFDVTKEKLIKAIYKVANNASYKQNAIKMNSIYLDRIMPSLEESKFYIERIIKKKNRQLYFDRKGMDLNLAKFFYIDLIILIFVLFLIVQG